MDPDQAGQPGGSVSLDGGDSYVEYTQSGTVLSGDRPQQLIYDSTPMAVACLAIRTSATSLLHRLK